MTRHVGEREARELAEMAPNVFWLRHGLRQVVERVIVSAVAENDDYGEAALLRDEFGEKDALANIRDDFVDTLKHWRCDGFAIFSLVNERRPCLILAEHVRTHELSREKAGLISRFLHLLDYYGGACGTLIVVRPLLGLVVEHNFIELTAYANCGRPLDGERINGPTERAA